MHLQHFLHLVQRTAPIDKSSLVLSFKKEHLASLSQPDYRDTVKALPRQAGACNRPRAPRDDITVRTAKVAR